jgi:hypothetical protein
MSKEEIKEELEYLKSNLNPKLLEKLKKMGGHRGEQT